MKKIRKSIISLITFLFIANKTYATTTMGVATGTYVVSDDSSIFGKLILLLVAVCLIALVLFIGYKSDEKEAKKNKKEKKQNRFNKEVEENTENYIRLYDNKMNIYSDDIQEKEEILEKKESNERKTSDETVIINSKEINDFENDNISDSKNNIEEDVKEYKMLKEDNIIDSVDIDDEEIDIEDVFLKGYEDLVNEETIQKKETNDRASKQTASELTMVFDTEQVRQTDEVTKEDKEFLELLEIEKTIAEANIKRYTRKKVKKPHIKRYTRKIVVEPKKRGRGRPRKTEQQVVVSAPKRRGRPRKEDQVEIASTPKKRGRGRPRKIDIESPVHSNTPKKRGRKPKNA